MASVASAGTTDRITARTLLKVLRAGSGTAARYASTVVGGVLPFAAEPRALDFDFFMPSNTRHVVHIQSSYFAEGFSTMSSYSACPWCAHSMRCSGVIAVGVSPAATELHRIVS